MKSDLVSRQAVIDALDSIGSLDTDADRKYAREVFEALPSAQPEITLLQATKTALEFIELCGGTTAFLITPDGEKLSCDWGYVEEGLRELVRYAERRTDGL